MRKIFFTILIIISVVSLGIIAGIYLYNKNNTVNERYDNSITEVNINENSIEKQNIVEISNVKEKTTPNTLLIYKTYYTKCKHYINKYKDIDISLVNLTQNEFKDLNKGWRIEEFSSQQVVLVKEVEEFCGEHYKLKLIDGKLIIYQIDENGKETEYEITDITEEFLTKEDVLKLKDGIVVYGKENLSSTIEDYE